MTSGAIVLVVASVLAAAPPSGKVDKPADPEELAKKILARKDQRFCHDPGYPLTTEELDWCEQLPATGEARCPGLRSACKAGARATMEGWRKPLDFDLPDLGGFAQTLLWTGLIVLLVLVVVVLSREMLITRRGRTTGQSRASPHDAVPGAGPGPDPVETDVLRLLERARAAAAAGDYREAIAQAYAALLRKLEGSGLVRVEAHRTNGDYLRDVGARQPGLRPRVRDVVTAVEAVQFGGEHPAEDRFRRVHDQVVGLCAERLGALLLLVGTMFSAGGCLPQRESWDDSPSGRSALRELLAKSGLKVSERVAKVSKLDDKVDTLVVLPDADVDPEDWSVVEQWVLGGGTVVFAGAPRPPADAKKTPPPTMPTWVDISFSTRRRDGNAPLVVDGAKASAPGTTITLPPSTTQLTSDQARSLLSRQGKSYAMEHLLGEEGGRVLVFADDRLFCNAALLAPGNATYLVELLSQGGQRVHFAGQLLGIVSSNPVSAVNRGRLSPVMLQLLGWALLFFIYRGAHFGRPQPEPEARRRSFSDHVRALALVYARARAGRVSLENYGAWATERLAERLRVQGRSSLSAIAEQIAARTQRPLGETMRLLVEARPGSPETSATATTTAAPAGRGEILRAENEALTSLRALAALIEETAGHQRQSTGHQQRGRSPERARNQ